MKFSINRLKAAFSTNKPIDQPHTDTYTDAIIKDVEGIPFALSDTNVMYAGMSELAGYHYFKTIIIGTFKIKTFKGAKLIINGADFKLELNSDMLELNSESTPVATRYITTIDFEIEHDDISKISRKTIESLEVIAKKNHVQFSILEGDDDEEFAKEELANDDFVDEIENMEEE